MLCSIKMYLHTCINGNVYAEYGWFMLWFYTSMFYLTKTLKKLGFDMMNIHIHMSSVGFAALLWRRW